MVRLFFWIDSKGRIGQSSFCKNDEHKQKEGIIKQVIFRYNYLVFFFNLSIYQESNDDKQNNKSKAVYSFRRKQLTTDDQIRLLHEAYQFLLKKYKLGEDPKAAQSLVSPFMQLELDPQEEIKDFEDSNDNGNIEKNEQEDKEEEVKDETLLKLERAVEKIENKGNSIKKKKSSTKRPSKNKK